jgi:predicted histidine transporter YuiF (NhaC family)
MNATDWQMITFFVPIIVALTEVIKRFGVDKKYYPVLNIIFGILVAYFFIPSGKGNVPVSILIGIIIGLSASGLYSSGKSTIEVVRNGNGN